MVTANMDRTKYFDNAASTPIDPRVLKEMQPWLEEGYGNASSIHAFGRRANEAVELARQRVAGAINAEDPSQITFTSGATETNNWILRSHIEVAISPFEHSSIHETAKLLGYETLANDGLSVAAPQKQVDLISVIGINNEIGAAIEPPETTAKIHRDLTQNTGKTKVDLTECDYATFSAHKAFGPKGIGALYSREAPPEPLLSGGGQENGHRAGTLNVPAIVGMGLAFEIASQEWEQDFRKANQMRQAVLEELQGLDYEVNGGENASPFILSVSFNGLEGESLLIELDRAGFAIGSGAACSAHSTEPSHVLVALGVKKAYARGTIRISFGRFNTLESAQSLGRQLAVSVRNMLELHRR